MLVYMIVNGSQAVEHIVLVATLGNTLGALTTWFLGVLAAKKFPLQSLLDEKHQKSVKTVKRWGIWTLLFSWLPVIGDGLCFAGGWLRLAFWPSCAFILIGKAFRYIFIAYFVYVSTFS